MLNKKYYWIRYDITIDYKYNHIHSQQCVSDRHPFNWLSDLKNISSQKREIVDWKEISNEEYNKGKSQS